MIAAVVQEAPVWTPASVSTLIVSVGAVLGTLLTVYFSRGTKQELKTANSKSIGSQVDANTTARFMLIPVEDRTESQVRHILDVPPEGVPAPLIAVEGNPTDPSAHPPAPTPSPAPEA